MSGIVAVAGPLAGEAFVRDFVRAMKYRGPHGDAVHVSDGVALGSAQLSAPAFATLGELAIVAHARLDEHEVDGATDAERILHTYSRWPDAFEEHLIGDFSLALWDGARRRLVCARDRFGIRPLYFARIGDSVVVTNTLPPLIDLVPRDLHRDALADAIVFGVNADVHRTTFGAISRVPPAHRLVVTGAHVAIERYWSMPIPDAPLRIDARDAVGELRTRLVAAVRSRARGRVVLSMSGGVDSTSVAAALVHGGVSGVRALSSVYDTVIPDEERQWATLAATALGIPIEFQVCDPYRPFERWDDPAVRGFEPRTEAFSAAFLDFMRTAASSGDVLLTGQGGDPALYTSHQYFYDLLRRGRLPRFLSEALGYAITRRRLPPLLLRSRILRRPKPEPPPWLREPLRAKWESEPPAMDGRVHPFRPEAFRLLMGGTWPAVFESFDAGVTRVAVEYAVPYFDLRLLEFLFALPPMPHFADKDIVRGAMKGWLPDRVRLRPKTPLGGEPLSSHFATDRDHWIDALMDADLLEELVDRRILCNHLRRNAGDPAVRRQEAGVVAVALWLQR